MLPSDIDFFFAPPTVKWEDHQTPDGTVSVLYLLRREIQDCLIGDVSLPESEVVPAKAPHRLFATAMVIFAGIDLLSKFTTGSDSESEAKRRFLAFCPAYLGTTSDEAGVLWSLRNGFVHSFGLWDKREKRYLSFALRDPNGQGRAVYIDTASQYWLVCVEELYAAFTGAVGKYQAKLSTDSALQRDFAGMFPRYGVIAVQVDP